jgi:hypothetical protein
MEGTVQDVILFLFENSAKAIKTKNFRNVDSVEVVFVDIVNGRAKHHRANGFHEILQAVENGGTPVGVIGLNWVGTESSVYEFPGITPEQQNLLMHAFAEAQDEQEELFKNEED